MWKGAVVLICVLAVAAAYQAIAPLDPKPEKFKNQEGCYMSELDKVVPIGSATPSTTSCAEYRCGQQNVVIVGCGAVKAEPPLIVVKDKSKPYPDCCPKIVMGPKKQ